MSFLDFFTCCDYNSNVKIHDSAQDVNQENVNSTPVSIFDSAKLSDDRVSIIPTKNDNLPTLVLDLDSTLVFSSYTPIENYNFKVNIQSNDTVTTIYVKERPYLRSFIKQCAEKYEMIIFTASKKVYASQVIERIDDKKCIKHILYRESCTVIDSNYIKDISLLGRDLNRTIIVDDSRLAFSLQPHNGILIKPYFGEDGDIALKPLCNKLIEIADSENIIECLKDKNKRFEL
jgi:CTD small phosphatase-like protein 2